MTDPAPVAAVVVTLNSERWIRGCLSALRRLHRPPAEVVVVDNGSADAGPTIVTREFPEARLIETGANTGFCHANNLGIAATTSPLILALNPDAVVDPSFLEVLLPAFDDPEVAIACGKLTRLDGKTLDSAGQRLGRSRRPVDRGYGTPDDGRYDRDEEVFGACAAAAVYRRSSLAAIAGPGGEIFDEAFFAFYEDLDVAWRARKFGFKAVYRHRATGRHARGGTASAPSPPRGMAMWRRPPEVRFHVAKNRYLTILRNDRPSDYLANLPFVLGRDAATAMWLLVTSPGVLVRLWRERAIFGRALALRRLDDERLRNEVTRGGSP